MLGSDLDPSSGAGPVRNGDTNGEFEADVDSQSLPTSPDESTPQNGAPNLPVDGSLTATQASATNTSSSVPTAPRQAAAPLIAAGLHPRSCVTCRRRKVRCDKRNPCSNCQKAKIECIFPAPGRAPRKPRKPPDSELLARLRKLEGVVQSLGGSPDDPRLQRTTSDKFSERLVSDRADGKTEAQARHDAEIDWRVDHQRNSLDKNFGRLVLKDGRARYVNNSFWANLSNEVEDIKGILYDSSSDEEELLSPSSTPTSNIDHSFMFGNHHLNQRELHSFHPPPHLVKEYWRIYEDHVDTLLNIIHRPSVRAQIDAVCENPASCSRSFEALLFVVYYAAVMSMSAEECKRIAGEPQERLSARYRHAVECALSKAHFLAAKELVTVQAFVVFLFMLRRHEDAQVMFSLNGLAVRLAISMGIHRDGTNFKLPPFEVEMRRRLWWVICLIDVRLSEDFGGDPAILDKSNDVQLPLNVNDDDLSPDMVEPPPPRKGITDMTLMLIRFEMVNVHRRLGSTISTASCAREDEVTLADKERWIEEAHHRLEQEHLQYCDMNVPIQWVMCTVARLIMAKLWLQIYQPFQRLDGGRSLPQDKRDKLFIISLESLEFSLLLETEIRTIQWSWLFKQYSQWHALAFLLSELCTRTRGPTVHRAWRAIDNTVESWKGRFGFPHKQHLWRPLTKLMTKARAARNRELARDNPMWQGANNLTPESTNEGQMSFISLSPSASDPAVNTPLSIDTHANALSQQQQHQQMQQPQPQRQPQQQMQQQQRRAQQNVQLNDGGMDFTRDNTSAQDMLSMPGTDAGNGSNTNGSFGPSQFFANQPELRPEQIAGFASSSGFNTELSSFDDFSSGLPLFGGGASCGLDASLPQGLGGGQVTSAAAAAAAGQAPLLRSSSIPFQQNPAGRPNGPSPLQHEQTFGLNHRSTWPGIPLAESLSGEPNAAKQPQPSFGASPFLARATLTGNDPMLTGSTVAAVGDDGMNSVDDSSLDIDTKQPDGFSGGPFATGMSGDGAFGGDAARTSAVPLSDHPIGWDDWNEMMRGVEIEGMGL